jgi:SP family galactose:H+ symporter-like MFS transporter
MKAESSPLRSPSLVILILAISISGTLYGYNIGAMSGVLFFVDKEMTLTHAQASLFVSSFLWGIVLVMFFMGHLADWIGRKKTLVLSAFTAVVSVVAMVLAHSIWQLIIGRLLVGVASGMLTMTVPLYLTETLPASLRGRGTVAFQLFLTFGILVSTIISWCYVRSFAWRPIFLFELVPVAFVLMISLFVPESPRWLAAKHRNDEALHVLTRLGSGDSAEKELAAIVKSMAIKKDTHPFKALFHRVYLFPLGLAISLGILNQFTGINAILQYDSTILYSSGFGKNESALLGSILITAINFVMTIVAICIVDRFERRRLLQFGLIGVVICLLGCSLVHFFVAQDMLRAILVTAFLLGYIVFFAIAPGALIWTLMAELLPSKIRSSGLALALLLTSIAGASLSALFLPLQDKIGFSGIFLLFAVTSSIYFVATFLMPPTKGLSLEEIEKGIVNRNGRT